MDYVYFVDNFFYCMCGFREDGGVVVEFELVFFFLNKKIFFKCI